MYFDLSCFMKKRKLAIFIRNVYFYKKCIFLKSVLFGQTQVNVDDACMPQMLLVEDEYPFNLSENIKKEIISESELELFFLNQWRAV